MTVSSTTFQGQPAIELRSPDGSKATILMHGAQVVSWQIGAGTGDEQLYVSPLADYSPGASVRGGVPVIFPQFAQRGPLPRHGFARQALWEFSSQTSGTDHITAVLSLRHSEASLRVWPHEFCLEMTVSLAKGQLDMELAVENLGASPFDFTAALHSYLRVKNIAHTTIEGLEGVRYQDVLSAQERTQTHSALQALSPIDRIYFDVPSFIALREPGRRIVVETQGFRDAVIWNPGAATGALSDMPADGYTQMCCVEAAQIARPIQLAPGQEWLGRQSLSSQA